jgi:hypothetical protein
MPVSPVNYRVFLFAVQLTNGRKITLTKTEPCCIKNKTPDTLYYKANLSGVIAKPYEQLNRRDVKKYKIYYKKFLAQLLVSKSSADSFYYNINKINFLQTNDLVTTGKHISKK